MQPTGTITTITFTVVNEAKEVIHQQELPATDNALARTLDGVPQRPANVPETAVKAVEVFARAMIDRGFWHGWFGDKSEAFFTDCVNNYLGMPNWVNRERAFSTLSGALENAARHTDVPLATLEEVAKHCGYKIEWQKDEDFPRIIEKLTSLPKEVS